MHQTHNRPTALLFLLNLLMAVTLSMMVWNAFFPVGNLRDASGMVMGRDFSNLWVGAKLFAQGRMALLFDLPAYNDYIQNVFGGVAGQYIWSYPPHFGLLLESLGYLPYGAALLVFEILTLMLLVGVVLMAAPKISRLQAGILLCTSPVVLPVLYMGQNGFLSGACILAAMLHYRRFPLLAGIALAVLTFKPQLGLAVVVALLALRAWKTLFYATSITVLWVVVSVWRYGIESWLKYVTFTLPQHTWMFTEHAADYFLVSPYGMLRSFGVSASPALLLHCGVAVIILTTLYRILRRSPHLSQAMQCILVAAATFLVTPYAQWHDMAALCGALILWGYGDEEFPRDTKDRVILCLLWILPAFVVHLYMLHAQIAPLILLVGFMVFSRKARFSHA